MNKSNKNFLILGHTGVGKSQLINYLFGQPVALAHAGKPVTKKGTWQKVTCTSPFKESGTLTFFDSWGLEANKAEEWKKLIAHKLSSTWDNDMIFSIIYCFSYAHRIEEFELDMICYLLSKEYQVLIVLTNADYFEHDEIKFHYIKRIHDKLSRYKGQYDIAEVCSVSIKKLSGFTKAFGKEQVLSILSKQSTDNIIRIFRKNISKLKNSIHKIIEETREEAKRPIDLALLFNKNKFLQFLFTSISGLYNDNKRYTELAKKTTERIKHQIESFGLVYQQSFGVSFEEQSWWKQWGNILTSSIDVSPYKRFTYNLNQSERKINNDLQKQAEKKIAEIKQLLNITSPKGVRP